MTILSGIFVLVILALVVDAADRRRVRKLPDSGLLPPDGQGSAGDIERLVSLGYTIDAIKLYRETVGVGIPIAGTPSTDPDVRNYRIRLLPG